MNLGLYLHVPFCRSKCLYCDFCSKPQPKEEWVRAYVEALKQDLMRQSDSASDYSVDTVYFGGGTPTFLSAELLCGILETVFRFFKVSPDAEITSECNPATASREKLSAMRRAGFNRLSLGLQSVHPNELKKLGRTHTYEDFLEVFRDARASGFANISVDVMSGIPEQTLESYLATLDRITSLSPEHISAYGLIVEEGTPFYRLADRLKLPDEETARQMYFEGIRALASRGFRQYEISNFCRPGYESRHNLKYWRAEPFLGFGPSAYSDFGGKRFGYSRNLEAYCRGDFLPADSETPSFNDRQNEFVMLAMRLADGISVSDFDARFGVSFEERFGDAVRRYIPLGLIRKTELGYAFTPEGMYVSNTVLSELLEFDP